MKGEIGVNGSCASSQQWRIPLNHLQPPSAPFQSSTPPSPQARHFGTSKALWVTVNSLFLPINLSEVFSSRAEFRSSSVKHGVFRKPPRLLDYAPLECWVSLTGFPPSLPPSIVTRKRDKVKDYTMITERMLSTAKNLLVHIDLYLLSL
ncbi:hypothetical protein CEXT_525121 [Caerostris extrusa]|uniref:Uncharacterized protein n=1 Tax=Caerostris extrusa TaxID=172846 RepID=A0AAV4N929_CAEEX|nr:hypothetical protein CEXT_525121 [Caerostris extrusa]